MLLWNLPCFKILQNYFFDLSAGFLGLHDAVCFLMFSKEPLRPETEHLLYIYNPTPTLTGTFLLRSLKSLNSVQVAFVVTQVCLNVFLKMKEDLTSTLRDTI
ncbi:hypothetical protein CRENBAI_009157 [Crenichthys baileyi]|uniref:Uncharacterized protein n=1 Tax=Crenichthys baileyi TaxID=28760 RepID=A0AAV9SKE5_9TELE